MTKVIVSIITARGGSKSIYKKNIIDICGLPLIAYPIQASLSSICQHIFVDTDCSEIAKQSRNLGASIIDRPPNLSGDDVDHGDVIRFSCRAALERLGHVDIFVVLLGNTVMISSDLIDEGVKLLASRSDASAVCSVWEAADDHPYRAMELRDGYLFSHSAVIPNKEVTTNRSSYKPAYFYDQGIWIFRSSNIDAAQNGPATWSWLGDRVLPIVRPWITGRDINGPFDVNFHRLWPELSDTPTSFPLGKLY